MAFDIVQTALDFIGAYGLIAIFVLLVLDGAMLLPVFPGEIVLIMAIGTYATDPSGLVMLIVLTSVAGLVGSLILYGIMRGGGRRVLERFPRLFMMPKRRRERLEKSFEKPLGQSLVLFLRVLPLTRVLVNIPAGLARMPFFRFVILSSIGLVAYHAGFLWFAYEVRRPGSELGDQAAQLQSAYASPAWDFVQTNQVATGGLLLVIGAFFSLRASRRIARDPEEGGGSLIGTLATAGLFWGGLVLAVATYLEPETVVKLAALGGADVPAVAAWAGTTVPALLFVVSAAMFLLALSVRSVRIRAKRWARKMQDREAARQGKSPAWSSTESAVAPSIAFFEVPDDEDRDGSDGDRPQGEYERWD